MTPLEALNPLDGRYAKHTRELAELMSEGALIKCRIAVEGEYLIALDEARLRPPGSGEAKPGMGPKAFSSEEKQQIRALADCSPEDLAKVKEYEATTNHDVKAVEYFMRERLAGTPLMDRAAWIHFALTSEDTNSVAYGLMLRDALEKAVLPALEEIHTALRARAAEHKALPMLARTHGQPATPTTVGKEFAVFAARLARQTEQLRKFMILVKFGGAAGNFNAHAAAYPAADWVKFAREFVARWNGADHTVALAWNPATTQIEPHDTYAELFDTVRRANVILLDLAQDMWRYVSDGWIVQKAVEGEVGSSTMPHKVNPIDFENAEGNLGVANALLGFFSAKLPVSRLQRDLSDSTVERSFGTALGHGLVAYRSLIRGLGKITVDEKRIRAALAEHPEVVTEAIQTILRREGVADAYEKLKEISRGKELSRADVEGFIDGLPVGDAVKQELKAITPENYIGLAPDLAEGI